MNAPAKPRRGRPPKRLDPALGPTPMLAVQMRQLREDAGLTHRSLEARIKQLAQVHQCSRGTIQRLEAGRYDPIPRQHFRAYVLGCGGDWDHWQAIYREYHDDYRVWSTATISRNEPTVSNATASADMTSPTALYMLRSRRLLTSVVATILTGITGLWLAIQHPNSPPQQTGAPPPPPPAVTVTDRPAMMITPNLVGMTIQTARDALPSTIKVTTIDTVDFDTPPGTVISQEPPPGAPIDDHMQLMVARMPTIIPLDSLRPISGEWSTTRSDSVSISGRSYSHPLSTPIGRCSPSGEVEYNLGKGLRWLVTTFGIADNATDTSTRVQLDIVGDGRSLLSTTIEYGKPTIANIDLTHVLRLTIRWKLLTNTSCTGTFLVSGDGFLVGLPDEIESSGITPTTTR